MRSRCNEKGGSPLSQYLNSTGDDLNELVQILRAPDPQNYWRIYTETNRGSINRHIGDELAECAENGHASEWIGGNPVFLYLKS